jgi:NAD(P)-dependent dehydrogenase (short-subunit alcohol dehydrogenase family)
MGRVADRIALVTGAKLTDAGESIGSATARALAREGAAVVVADLDGDSAERLAAELRAGGSRVESCAVDISDESSVERMIRFTVDRFGRLDILVNNAAMFDAGDLEPLTMSVDVWDRTMAVNARGPMLVCKHGLAAMLERGDGSIVNLVSAQAMSGDITRPAYGAAKAATVILTKQIATVYGKRGIRCNAVAPGLTLTPLVKSTVPQLVRDTYLRHVLTPTLGEPEDLANVVLFLASDESRYVTGQVLLADGGMSAHRPFVADFAGRPEGSHARGA